MKGKLGLAHLERREITLNPDQNEISLMGTAIHEVLHLEQWDLSEEAVIRIEKNITDVLCRLGFRRTEKDGE
jgi:hypothetical protein